MLTYATFLVKTSKNCRQCRMFLHFECVRTWLSVWKTTTNMQACCQTLHNRFAQKPSLPPSLDHNCPFLSVFCFCFVAPHLWWYLSQWRIQKPALVWKKSHLQSFTLTKKLYFNITITSDNSIYLPCSFCATNEQRYTRFYCSGLNVP